MKNRNFILTLMIALAIGVFFASCKKTPQGPAPITGEALFTYVADGYTVTFTNTSTVSGTVTYNWDFGDDSTSTEKNPVHTYLKKGTYHVTLNVLDEQGGKHSVSTDVAVNKKTRISLTDNSFSDWDAVTEDNLIVHFSDTVPNVVSEAKFDYDANMVYVYIKYTGVDSLWFDTFMDNDNDTTTGSRNWLWPDMGAEYLIEGQFAKEGGAAAAGSFYFNGATQDAWSWADDKPFPQGFLTMGTITNSGGTVTMEFGLSREKIPGLNNDVTQIAIMLSDPVTWGDIGHIPNPGGAGFTLDMK